MAEDRCCKKTAAPACKDVLIPELEPGFVELMEFLITLRSAVADEAEALQEPEKQEGNPSIHPSIHPPIHPPAC